MNNIPPRYDINYNINKNISSNFNDTCIYCNNLRDAINEIDFLSSYYIHNGIKNIINNTILFDSLSDEYFNIINKVDMSLYSDIIKEYMRLVKEKENVYANKKVFDRVVRITQTVISYAQKIAAAASAIYTGGATLALYVWRTAATYVITSILKDNGANPIWSILSNVAVSNVSPNNVYYNPEDYNITQDDIINKGIDQKAEMLENIDDYDGANELSLLRASGNVDNNISLNTESIIFDNNQITQTISDIDTTTLNVNEQLNEAYQGLNISYDRAQSQLNDMTNMVTLSNQMLSNQATILLGQEVDIDFFEITLDDDGFVIIKQNKEALSYLGTLSSKRGILDNIGRDNFLSKFSVSINNNIENPVTNGISTNRFNLDISFSPSKAISPEEFVNMHNKLVDYLEEGMDRFNEFTDDYAAYRELVAKIHEDYGVVNIPKTVIINNKENIIKSIQNIDYSIPEGVVNNINNSIINIQKRTTDLDYSENSFDLKDFNIINNLTLKNLFIKNEEVIGLFLLKEVPNQIQLDNLMSPINVDDINNLQNYLNKDKIASNKPINFNKSDTNYELIEGNNIVTSDILFVNRLNDFLVNNRFITKNNSFLYNFNVIENSNKLDDTNLIIMQTLKKIKNLGEINTLLRKTLNDLREKSFKKLSVVEYFIYRFKKFF